MLKFNLRIFFLRDVVVIWFTALVLYTQQTSNILHTEQHLHFSQFLYIFSYITMFRTTTSAHLSCNRKSKTALGLNVLYSGAEWSGRSETIDQTWGLQTGPYRLCQIWLKFTVTAVLRNELSALPESDEHNQYSSSQPVEQERWVNVWKVCWIMFRKGYSPQLTKRTNMTFPFFCTWCFYDLNILCETWGKVCCYWTR